jgi:TolA-binding protein
MENNFDHIERFLSGAMSQDEMAEFEKRKSADKELEKDILLYQQANELIRAGARKRMKQHLDDLGRKEFANTMVETYMRYNLLKKYWYAIAASILLLIGLSYFAYQTMQSNRSIPTLAQVFDAYYEVPKTDLIISRGNNAEETLSFAWNSALRKYDEGSYADAVKDFKAALSDSGFAYKSAANFYLGNCYLQMNIPDSAVSCFGLVSPASSLSQDAGWYLGLSYLKAGNKQKAAEVFENITNSKKHFKKEQAEDIIKLVDRMK